MNELINLLISAVLNGQWPLVTMLIVVCATAALKRLGLHRIPVSWRPLIPATLSVALFSVGWLMGTELDWALPLEVLVGSIGIHEALERMRGNRLVARQRGPGQAAVTGVLLFVLALAPLAGCVSSASGPSDSYARFLRVHPPKGEKVLYVVERSVAGDRFRRGELALHGHPRKNMPVHRMGALPVKSGVFRLWNATEDPYNAPLPRARKLSIPAEGGPWRGVVVELQGGLRYPAVLFNPVPLQPSIRRPLVATEMLLCKTANLLACLPWAEAVQAGLVTCETPRRTRQPADSCVVYVPHTKWYVDGRGSREHGKALARGPRGAVPGIEGRAVSRSAVPQGVR